jgi:hypothetical protein
MEPPPLTSISLTKHSDTPEALIADGAVNGNGTGATHTEAASTATAVTSLTVSGSVSVIGIIESEFLRKLREKFLGTNAMPQPWPSAAATGMPSLAADEFVDAFRLLFMLKEDFAPIPSDGAPGSARKLLAELVEETGWPDPQQCPVPAPWNVSTETDKFRRYEIACAVGIMMRAYDAPPGGVGGGSTPFPPDH